jgi:hypothetical protein
MSTTARSPIATVAQRQQQAQWPAGQRGSARNVGMPSRQPVPLPPITVVPGTVPLQRRKSQRRAVTLIVTGAVFCVAMGLLYLSGYAGLQFELNRRVRLQAQLRAAEERSRLYQEHMAQVNSNEYIEQEAQKARMVLADDRQAVTLGQTSSGQSR